MRLIDAEALLKEYEGAFAYKMLKEIIDNAPTVNEPEVKLNLIWKEINNAYYFGDMKKRNFYNLIHEVAQIIKPNYEEIGKKFIE